MRQSAAEAQGIIVADTKFELGWIDGKLCFCDEVLTPDSSRFWPAGEFEPGTNPPSFDKQPVRDWLEASGWDKQPPPPHLPDGDRSRDERAVQDRLRADLRSPAGRLVRCLSAVRCPCRGAASTGDRRPGGRHDRTGLAGARFLRRPYPQGRKGHPLRGRGRRRTGRRACRRGSGVQAARPTRSSNRPPCW